MATKIPFFFTNGRHNSASMRRFCDGPRCDQIKRFAMFFRVVLSPDVQTFDIVQLKLAAYFLEKTTRLFSGSKIVIFN